MHACTPARSRHLPSDRKKWRPPSQPYYNHQGMHAVYRPTRPSCLRAFVAMSGFTERRKGGSLRSYQSRLSGPAHTNVTECPIPKEKKGRNSNTKASTRWSRVSPRGSRQDPVYVDSPTHGFVAETNSLDDRKKDTFSFKPSVLHPDDVSNLGARYHQKYFQKHM